MAHAKVSKEKEYEEKIEKGLERKLEKELKRRIPSYLEPLLGAVLTAVFFILLNNYYDKVDFINSDFSKVLPYLNFSLALSVVVYGVQIIFHSKKFKHFSEIVTNLVFFVVVYQIWTVFPFDTSEITGDYNWNIVIRSIIVLITLAVAIGTVVEAIKLMVGEEKNRKAL
jgi:hypothetical protein